LLAMATAVFFAVSGAGAAAASGDPPVAQTDY
jgi:hypothetical protein